LRWGHGLLCPTIESAPTSSVHRRQASLPPKPYIYGQGSTESSFELKSPNPSLDFDGDGEEAAHEDISFHSETNFN
jgi:hypothetical protein